MTSEQAIHERVWALYQGYRTADAVMFHVANGEKRGARTAAKLKRMGVVAGVPDFLCMARGRAFFLELKRPKGRISDEQFDFAHRCVLHGVSTLFAKSVEQAVRMLQHEGVLRDDVKFSVTCGPGDRGAQDASEAQSSGASNSKFTSEAVIVA